MAGSRRDGKDVKSKGKRKREASPSTSDSDRDDEDGNEDEQELPTKKSAKTHGGRRPNSGNYSEAEVKKLLHYVERELPVGQTGWKRVAVSYETWALKNGRSPRDAKALEGKFKRVRVLPAILQYAHYLLAREDEKANWYWKAPGVSHAREGY